MAPRPWRRQPGEEFRVDARHVAAECQHPRVSRLGGMAERGAQSAERTELRCRPVGEMRDGERAGEPSADDQRIAVLDQYVSGVCDQRTPGPHGKRLVAAEAPCAAACEPGAEPGHRSEEHTTELQSHLPKP